MSDEAFIRAIQAKPLDVAYRLVYADYLDEQDDPRGTFLRCTCELDTPNRPLADIIRTHQQLNAIEPTIDAAWITQVMANRVWLRYHRNTFALLGETPTLDAKNVKLMDKWEKKYDRKLPAALREWYSMQHPYEPSDFSIGRFIPARFEDVLRVPRRVPQATPSTLYFDVWSDFDVGYYVPLNEGDDPNIVFDGSIVELKMGTVAQNLFNFAWTLLLAKDERDWFHPTYAQPFPPVALHACLHITGTMFGPRDLRHLQASFVEHRSQYTAGKPYRTHNPFTREESLVWGPPSQLRFYAPGVAIKVTCKGDPRKRAKECYWEIASRSEKTLYDVVATYLWKHGDLAAHLSSPTKSGKKVLQRLQKLA